MNALKYLMFLLCSVSLAVVVRCVGTLTATPTAVPTSTPTAGPTYKPTATPTSYTVHKFFVSIPKIVGHQEHDLYLAADFIDIYNTVIIL